MIKINQKLDTYKYHIAIEIALMDLVKNYGILFFVIVLFFMEEFRINSI